MEQTQQQMAMQQEAMQQQQQRIQLDLSIMQFKMNILVIAKDMHKDTPKNNLEDVMDTYFVMRQEVLGIPVPIKDKEQSDQLKGE